MKKILILLLLTLFSFVLVAQERELSDYEKYRMEKDNERLGQQDEEVFYIVEDMPKFQGEDGKEFRKYITENVRYPQEAVKNNITGKVIVSFIVNKNGKVVNAQVEKSVDITLDAEAVRVVMSSPKWEPGKQRGEAVNVKFTFPINFVLDNQEQTEPVVINNYYNDYTQPNLRFNLTFGYGYGYYNHYYDPWYNYGYGYGYPSYGAWYGGYYNYEAYYGMYYPYYGHGYYPYYYGHNNYNRGYRYATSNTLGWNRNYYQPYNKTYSSGYVTAPTASKKNVVATRSAEYTKSRTAIKTNNGTRQSYTPTYNKARTTTRPEYNGSATRTTTVQQRSTQQKNTYVRPTQTQTRSSSTYTRPSSSSRSQSYSTPSRSSSSYRSAPSRAPSTAPSRSYSAPSRSSGSSYSAPSRSSSSSGGASRSSSGGKK